MATQSGDRFLKGRVALVTGSTGYGIGRSAALVLARAGATVIVNYGSGRSNQGSAAREALREIARVGPKGGAIKADTKDPRQVRAMIRSIHRKYKRLDILVNNACGHWEAKPFEEIDPDHWKAVIDIEVNGPFYTMREAIPLMRRRKWGRVVNLNVFGVEHQTNPPFDYRVGKVGRMKLTQMLLPYEIASGITINSVSPGYIRYSLPGEALRFARDGKEWRAREESHPHDVARAILWLCSDDARFVTGANITIAGNRRKESQNDYLKTLQPKGTL
ncbi:MAG: hypothetical protein A2Z34_04240 [Planctomycetes bacterium RBG_16_59_8]|nr:MAG: hypothetical protein A2Z34_04240 [Planctomycetes bacterium RBG_16_59_8]